MLCLIMAATAMARTSDRDAVAADLCIGRIVRELPCNLQRPLLLQGRILSGQCITLLLQELQTGLQLRYLRFCIAIRWSLRRGGPVCVHTRAAHITVSHAWLHGCS